MSSQLNETSVSLMHDASGWLLCSDVFVSDRPGEVAGLSSVFGSKGATIEHFFFNRSEDPHRVRLAVRCKSAAHGGELADSLLQHGRFTHPETNGESNCRVVDPAGLLQIKVSLEDKPGTLARFGEILKKYDANVIHLEFDKKETAGIAQVSLATPVPEMLELLLQHLTRDDFHFTVAWHGDGDSIDAIIGLNQVETFLFKLRAILPQDKIDELSELLHTSDEMRQALFDFRREAGENEDSMATSEVFSHILHLAAASLGKLGQNFSLQLTGPLRLTPQVSMYMLACPTGANSFLLRTDADSTLIDSSYGLYFPDVVQWLSGHAIDPSRITRIALTHADADHAGWASPMQETYGTEVFMHPDSLGIFEHQNRAYGSDTQLMALNSAYTRLINRLTELSTPKKITPYPPSSSAISQRGAFKVIGEFQVADLHFEILESHGGHVPAQIFLLEPEYGLFFCGDYLIDVPSLSDRTKSTLSIARYLMTSTNSDSRLFGKEMRALKDLLREIQAHIADKGRTVMIFPGHGEFYRISETDWL